MYEEKQVLKLTFPELNLFLILAKMYKSGLLLHCTGKGFPWA
jgi:hypothetical protein